MGVVGHGDQSGLPVVNLVPPEGDDGNVEEHDGGGQDVGGALQGDGEQSFGLVEGFWHVGCLTTNATLQQYFPKLFFGFLHKLFFGFLRSINRIWNPLSFVLH